MLNELLPHPDNRVTLADETDRHGMPIARMDYTQSDNDRANIAYAKRVLNDIWEAAGAQDRLTIDRYAHLVGGCRMGTSPETSVIDADHRVWGVPNLFIADGSVMPTQGSRQPGADDHGARLAPRRAPGSQARGQTGRREGAEVRMPDLRHPGHGWLPRTS